MDCDGNWLNIAKIFLIGILTVIAVCTESLIT